MKTNKHTILESKEKLASNISINSKLSGENYQSSKLDKVNKMLSGLNLKHKHQPE